MINRNIFSITGGLGNQLFQLAAALNLQNDGSFYIETELGVPRRNSDGLAEILSYSLPDNLENLKERKFRWITSKAVGYRLRMEIYPRNYEKIELIRKFLEFSSNVVLSLQIRKKYRILPAEGLGYNEISLSGTNNFVIGYFQSYKWASEPRVLEILKNLKLTSNLQEIEDYKALALVEKPLVVHIRLGDYKNQSTFGIPGPDYYENAIKELWKSGAYKKIWIFSDEPDLAGSKLPIQYTEHYRWVNEVGGSPSATLEVMRLGTGYVIANSSFSWWGAFLSTSDSPKVICPFPWFIGEISPKELIPPNWSQLPISIDQKGEANASLK